MRSAVAMALVLASCSTTVDTDGRVDAWAQANGVNSVVVAIATPDGEVDVLANNDEGTTGLFQVGSLTKTVVAVAALRLVERGVLDLDAPIATWSVQVPRAEEITMRQLLSHTAGISDRSDEEPDLSDLTAFLRPQAKADLVGSVTVGAGRLPAPHMYANSGYWVAGAVIEAATGEPLEQVLRELIFEPLEMDDTYAAWSAFDQELVPGEISGPDREPVALGTEPVPGIITAAWAAGGIVSTAADMAAFYSATFDGFLTEESLAALTAADPSGYGLGIERRPGQAWGHNGAIPGYTASAVVSADGTAVVVVTNQFRVVPGGLEPDTEAFAVELLSTAAAAAA